MTNEAIIRKAKKKIRAAILEGDLTKAIDELTIAARAIKDNDKQALFEEADGSTNPKGKDSRKRKPEKT